MGAAAELEQQAVLADLAVGAEALGGGGEVDGAVVLVDLDGVAAAEGDVRAAFAAQVGEVAALADLAVRDGAWRRRSRSARSARDPRRAGCGAWRRARRSSI